MDDTSGTGRKFGVALAMAAWLAAAPLEAAPVTAPTPHGKKAAGPAKAKAAPVASRADGRPVAGVRARQQPVSQAKPAAAPARQATARAKAPVPHAAQAKAAKVAKVAPRRDAPKRDAAARAEPRLPQLPPPVAVTLPPLGPERFYPNGVPELHPAFLYPLPGTPVPVAQSERRHPGSSPDWLP